MRYEVPNVPTGENTTFVKKLLNLIDQLFTKTRKLSEEIKQLKDEVNVLKKEKKRPEFKASKMDDLAGKKDTKKEDSSKGKRPGSNKKNKTVGLKIHEKKIIKPDGKIPHDSEFKGYQDYTVQGLRIESHNVLYRLECWKTPGGDYLRGRLPDSLEGTHFSPKLRSFIIYQHHHCQVTQPLLWEQLSEWGVQISKGQINRILNEGKEDFHDEKEDILPMGLQVSEYVTVDDSGMRNKGKNGYVTHIGNDYFAWFKSSDHKTRINFLELLNTENNNYTLNNNAVSLMLKQKMPLKIIKLFENHSSKLFKSKREWHDHLNKLRIFNKRHYRIATEAALYASVLQHEFMRNIVILSDGAGQFNVLLHALCWVHTERLIHKLVPLNDPHRKIIEQIRGQIWDLYAELKKYKLEPSIESKNKIQDQFDSIFTQKTPFETLNNLLTRIHKNKDELLLVLLRPEIPLHTNGSEGDIREYVKKMKISGGTRSDLGRQCRDTFASLKKTCRKLDISFWCYLIDRLSCANKIKPLHFYIQQRAAPSIAY
ncbi:MAG: transposase [Candidatus Margulisbacteria bacterium]|nr:transposase [Candidatus Margulisiibacteriota bacterium]